MTKIYLFFFFGLLCTATISAQTWEIGSPIAADVTATLSGSTLTISGTGAIQDYPFSNGVPWFAQRNAITSIDIGEGVTSIGNYVFNKCSSLTSVTIPASVTSIGDYAFGSCENLISITIPLLVTHIGDGIFYNCRALTSITVDAANLAYSSYDDILFNKDMTTLVSYPAGKQGSYYVIPSSVTTIGYDAFTCCENLTSVTIPTSVTSIGELAFSECSGLVSITIPASVTSIGDHVFEYCRGLTSITILASITSIGDYAFFRCYSLTSITIPASVTSIGEWAFYCCDGLTSITIPASVTSIGEWAFYWCEGLTSITIPASVTSIGEYAFGGCSGLISITIPASLTSIGKWAFEYCDNLSEIINISRSPQNISSNVFDKVDFNTCILKVPDASVHLYGNAEGWNQFHNIVALDAGITLDKNEIYLLPGVTTTITAKVTGDVTDPDITLWNSSNETVATVNNTGTIKAIKAGTTVITCSIGSIEATCTVTVIQTGNSTITGTVVNPGSGNTRVNLYINTTDPILTKRGIIGGYVLLATTVPNDDGTYSFENLPEGVYQVEVEIEEYEPAATDELPLSENETLKNVNFTVDEEEGIIIVAGEPDPDPDPDPETLTGTVETWHAASLQICPNPFTDVVHITVQTGRAPSLRMQVINTAGAIVHSQTIISPDETIHLGHLPAGLYFIRFENGNTIKTIKTIKIQ